MKPKLMFFDHGLCVSFAQQLAEWFTVFYFCPYLEEAFPSPNKAIIGDGIPEITRCKDFWQAMPDMDYFFFADIYSGGLQEHLRSLGKAVFGQGRGEELEIFRWKMRGMLESLDLPKGEADRVIGMDSLREYLQANDDTYVKVSCYRALCETFHCESYDLIKPRLDEVEADLGGLASTMPFIIEKKIEAAVEIGSDGYTIDGQFPRSTIFGVEDKDASYIGRLMDTAKLPLQVNRVNASLSRLFKEYTYRMFFSTEIRVTEEGEPFLIDFTARLPLPPSELFPHMYDNLPEIVTEGANGVMVHPKMKSEYGAIAIISSSFAEEKWQPVMIPNECRPFVHLRNNCIIDGVDYVVPSNIKMGEIGAVVGVGSSVKEAVMACKKVGDQIKGYDIKVRVASLFDCLESIREAEKNGVKFTDDKLPTPEEILL